MSSQRVDSRISRRAGGGGEAGRRHRKLKLAFAWVVGVVLAADPGGAQNLLTNGDFHTDVAGWETGWGTLLWTNITEVDGCTGSGAALISSAPTAGQHYASISQCVPLAGESMVAARVHHMGYGTFIFTLQFYTAFNCTTGALTSVSTNIVQTPTVWQTNSSSAVPPANAHAVEIILTAIDSEPHGLVLDGLILTDGWSIFLDGFEGNPEGESDPCRWSP